MTAVAAITCGCESSAITIGLERIRIALDHLEAHQ
jgi:hypothetical protein